MATQIRAYMMSHNYDSDSQASSGIWEDKSAHIFATKMSVSRLEHDCDHMIM